MVACNKSLSCQSHPVRSAKHRITGYQAFKVSTQRGGISRDREWKETAAEPKLVGAYSVHLGGDRAVQWAIDVGHDSDFEIFACCGDKFRQISWCSCWMRASEQRRDMWAR
jgi:hypothetical protein